MMEWVEAIVELYRRMSCELPADVTAALERAREREEKGSLARDALETILENVTLARQKQRPLCQDTGCPVFYVTRPPKEAEIRERALRATREMTRRRTLRKDHGGSSEAASEAEIREAILEATREATRVGYLRPNAVDPVTGVNSGDNTGDAFPVIHIREADCSLDSLSPQRGEGEADALSESLSPQRGERVRVRGGGVEETSGVMVIDAMLKGGGSENVGERYRLPDASLQAGRDLDGVRRCVLDAVWRAQGRGCPPYVVAVAIGGAHDATATLAKRQLLRRLDDTSPVDALAQLEARLLEEVNRLGIGPAGLGGKTTAIGVKLAAQHRHVACFFVEVSIGCWAMRRGRLIVGQSGVRHE